MQYENPRLPEDINVSERRPLAAFFGLSFGLITLVAVLGGALLLLAGQLAPLVPFRYETAIAGKLFSSQSAAGPIEPYLQDLAARLAREQDLPEEVTISVHYDDGALVNAFATLGGHVVIFRGLLEAVPDENTLAMVLAHEIAHVRHRHPAVAAGRAAALGFALMLVGADSGAGLVQGAVSRGGALTMLSFSRAQEAEADETALGALARAYGHVGGAETVFRLMLERAGGAHPPAFLASHPLAAERIDAVRELARRRGWRADGERRPLPAEVQARIRRGAAD